MYLESNVLSGIWRFPCGVNETFDCNSWVILQKILGYVELYKTNFCGIFNHIVAEIQR